MATSIDGMRVDSPWPQFCVARAPVTIDATLVNVARIAHPYAGPPHPSGSSPSFTCSLVAPGLWPLEVFSLLPFGLQAHNQW